MLLILCPSVRNGGAAGKRFVAVGRLPVSGDDQLCAIQELGSIKQGSGEVGSVEHCFEKICSFQVGTGYSPGSSSFL
jgi:hypothetical protein